MRKKPVSSRTGRPLSLGRAGLLALASFCLLTFAFPPFELGWVGFVALAPWIYAVMKARFRDVVLVSWALGVVFFTVNLYWIGYVTVLGWLVLCVFYLSFYFLAFGACARLLYRRVAVPMALLLPPVWVGLEFAREHLLTGFPWFFLGYSQYRHLPLIQIADITSVYGVSFALVAVNASVADGFGGRVFGRGVATWRRVAAAAWPLALLAGICGYGHFRLGTAQMTVGPKVCVIQGNIPQSLKLEPESAEEILEKHMNLTKGVADSGADLIVWPETMVPYALNLEPGLQNDFGRLARETRANLLLGAVSVEGTAAGENKHNSAYYVRRDGRLEGRYDKLHLVPFGEFIPLRRHLPFLRRFMPYDPGFTPGRSPQLFELDGSAFGVSICYEDTLPRVVRAIAGGRADIFINITNDGWFRGSPELEQHFAFCVFRAVENRVPVVRAANTGISGFVEPTGRIESILRDDAGRVKEVAGSLCASLALWKGESTFYERRGDVMAWIFLVWAVLACLAAVISPFFGRSP